MTTVIDSRGRLKAVGNQTLAQGCYSEYDVEVGVKVICSSVLNPSAGVVISWTSAVWDTSRFVSAFPTQYLVIPRKGYYSVHAYVKPSVSTGYTGILEVQCNGVALHHDRANFSETSGFLNALQVLVAWHYFLQGDSISVLWDANGVNIANAVNEPGISCTVWREA